jgi:uncharacterized membrane protein
MRSGLLAVVAFIAGALLWPTPSKADFRVCNFSAANTDVAFGYYEPQDGWSSRGWMKLQVGECKTALHGALRNGTYYVYGHSEDGRVFAGPSSQSGGFFCIQKPRFELRSNAFKTGEALDCEAGGMKAARFLAVSVTSPEFTYTLSPDVEQISGALGRLGSIIRDERTTPSGSNAAAGANTPNSAPLPAQPAPAAQPVTSQTASSPPASAQAAPSGQPSMPPAAARPSGGGSSPGTACQRFPNLC